ncbi:type II toxin-antitoxin system VapC family toxin [Xanthomonas translucens]|uniref:type II toxin-antitoxin system VapC family toxin n=1 Tax=Xanthomonas campestris pv. translucens TaxID=343 RepID=UPI00083A5845|nr:type II toxin-antitoxin system VapC family toxin [Xanthomonas translucens]QEO25188.1 type II toxin-antitoxin system VapC family toxin [Xanthomonas translucens pv. undulosa]
MSTSDRLLLLDRHVWIWLSLGTPGVFAPAMQERLNRGDRSRPLHVSFISAWEVAMLSAKGCLNLAMPAQAWIERSLAHPAMRLIPLDSTSVAVESNELPGAFHADPADRLLVATARIGGFVLVTRDQKILDYGAAGHVNVLAA